MRILVIAAHPDDEVLGCGATINRLQQQGQHVSIAILGEGLTSRYENRQQVDRRMIQELQSSSRRAIKHLGIEAVEFFGLPDNRFDSIPLLDICKLIEAVIVRVEPEVIFTHHPGDLNIDHILTARAALTAARPLMGQTVKEIYSFESPSSSEWTFGKLGQQFVANVFYDISSFLENKVKAIGEYDSELRPFPHPRSPEALRARAKNWGSIVGLQAAEAFELIRAVR